MSLKDNPPVKRTRGRPRKTDIEAKKARGVVGRPPGEAARIKEFYARLLTTSGETVINTVLKKALDDTDKDQIACLKMCIDRMLPVSYFEKDKVAGGKSSINITISGVNEAHISPYNEEEQEPIEAEYEETDD